MKNQMKIFTEGAFSLEDGTDCAAAIMPYYAISWNQDKNMEKMLATIIAGI